MKSPGRKHWDERPGQVGICVRPSEPGATHCGIGIARRVETIFATARGNAFKIGTLHWGLSLSSFFDEETRKSTSNSSVRKILLARTRELTLWAPLAADAFVIVPPDHRHFHR
jgi:hypothetical protein